MKSSYYRLPFRPIDIMDGKSKVKTLKRVSVIDSIDEHIKLMFVTAHGDLRYDHDYGSIVNDLDFSNERQSGLFERIIENSMRDSLTEYEPRLSGIGVRVRFDRKGELINSRNDNYRMYINVDVQGRVVMTNESFKSNFTVFFAPISE